ncbi:MAG: hypothetical protein ACRYFX_05025 [Janthinobacterium lividum]
MRNLYCLLASLVLAQTTHAQTSTLTRALDPVVLAGSSLPNFVGQSPGSLVGFRYGASGWQQIPVQVDERALLDIAAPYGPNGAGTDYPTAATNPKVLFYCDASTPTGADANATFDADDELVFLVREAGGRAVGVAPPAGTVASTCHELTLTDPLGGVGYVYLFRQAGALAQGAGTSYLTYTSNLTSTTGFPVKNANAGTNAENTTIATSRYSWHFAASWVCDQLKLPLGTNVDILDRYKAFFYDGFCGRSEDTFSDAENAFICVKAGPVRVIRSYMGANSGTLTQRTHLFYEGRQDILTDLRVHNIPAIRDVLDYAPAASGMTYRNNLNPNGVTVNGQPDIVTKGNLTWEQVSGPQGTLSVVFGRNTTLTAADATFTSYYDDNAASPASNCTGDGQAWGTSGVAVDFGLTSTACTDPLPARGCGMASASFRTLQFQRTLYADAPTAAATQAATYAQQRAAPLLVAVSACATTTATARVAAPPTVSVYPNPSNGHVSIRLGYASWLRVYNQLGQMVQEQALPAGISEVQLPAGLLQLVFKGDAGLVGVRVAVQ